MAEQETEPPKLMVSNTLICTTVEASSVSCSAPASGMMAYPAAGSDAGWIRVWLWGRLAPNGLPETTREASMPFQTCGSYTARPPSAELSLRPQ